MKRVHLLITIATLLLINFQVANADVFSNNSGDPTIDLIKRILVDLGRYQNLGEVKEMAYALKKVEAEYKVNPVLMIAVMEEELKFNGFPQAHAFQYNVDRGMVLSNDQMGSLPSPYHDIDCVGRALASQIETFHGDTETAVAAYFFGTQNMKSRTVADLDERGKAILQNIFDFVQKYTDERPNKAEIKMTSTPKVVKNTKPTSRTIRRNPSTGEADRQFSSIEEKYISVMKYFNKKIDEKVASEIYWAIAALHNEYPHVDARLVMALVAVESAFRPDAVSCKGAQGLGQLMPFTANSLNVDNPFDCTENIRGTFKYLDREFKRWQNERYPLDLVLAAYNAGPEAVKKHGNDIPPYKETQAYVKKVVNIYSQLLLEDEYASKLKGKTRYYR